MCGSQSADISMVERRFHVPARRHRLSTKTALKTAGVDWSSHINVSRITCARSDSSLSLGFDASG
jgi:hypothetical protein